MLKLKGSGKQHSNVSRPKEIEYQLGSNVFLSSLECIELHLNITPFEGYPQGGPDQGNMVPTNPDSNNSKTKISSSTKKDVFILVS